MRPNLNANTVGLLAALSASLAFGQAIPTTAPSAVQPPPVTKTMAPAITKPQAAGAQPPVVKPGMEAPKPTVELKPGEVPGVEFDTPIYDFGRVRAGVDITHDFWFTNTGNGPLEVLAVRPSCGCTTAGPHDTVVQPGESGKIPIKIGTAHFNGPITKSVSVTTNAPGAGANISLQVKGELWQVVQVTPNAVSFGRLTEEDARKEVPVQKLSIAVNTEAKAQITDVKSSNPQFAAEVKEVEPGKKFDLVVSVIPPLKSGNNFGTIDLKTGVPEMPDLKVSVSAFVAAEVEVMPQQLYVSTGQKIALKRQIFVRNNGKNPLKLTDLAANNPQLKLDLKETAPGNMFQITVDIPADYAKKPEGDAITFKTDKVGMAEVKVPIIEQQMPTQAIPTAAVQPVPANAPVQKPGIVQRTAPVAKGK